MKKARNILMPFLFFFLASCDKEDMAQENYQEARIMEIILSQTSGLQEPQEISVKIDMPTPCHQISEVRETITGKTYTYDFILAQSAGVCAQVIDERTVKVVFDPSEGGVHTLNFLINGKLQEIRTVTVTE